MIDIGCTNLSTDEAIQTLQLIYTEVNKVSSTLIGIKNNDELGFYCPKTGVILSDPHSSTCIFARDTYGIISEKVSTFRDGIIRFDGAKIYFVECNKTMEFTGTTQIIEVPLADYKYIVILNDKDYNIINAVTGEIVKKIYGCKIQRHYDLDNPTGIVITFTTDDCIYAITKDGEFGEIKNMLSKFNPIIIRKGKGKQYKIKGSNGEEFSLNELGQRYSE